MKLKHRPTTRNELDLTPLINIVFLILIFFIVAGALRPYSARDLQLAKTSESTSGRMPPSKLIAYQDGRLQLGANETTISELGRSVEAAALDKTDTFIVVADGRLSAEALLQITNILHSSGIKTISVMTEREAANQ